MRIVDYIDPDARIKKVRLRGLRPCRPGQFQIVLELKQAEAGTGLELLVTLDHKDETSYGQVFIAFADCLPENRIPKHAISSECFLEEGVSPELVWHTSVAMMLMEQKDTVITLTEECGNIVAVLSLGAWETEGKLPLDQTSHYLQAE